MYSTVKQCVRYNGNMSDFFSSHIRLKQGHPSLSLMFIMLVNDILSCINTDLDGIFTVDELKIFLLLFEDDAVLFAHSPESLQLMLNDLDQYCRTLGLTVNIENTKVMVFERGRGTSCNISLNNTQLEVFQVFRYTTL